MISDTLITIERLGGEMFKNMKILVENNLDEIVRAGWDGVYELMMMFICMRSFQNDQANKNSKTNR